ncbi:Intradiol ring-cleavage dioxygenase [Aspergillus venezuelensis]
MIHLAQSLLVGLAGLASIASAHPGHDVKAEAAERAASLKNTRGVAESNVVRRESAVQQLREKNGHTTNTLLFSGVVASGNGNSNDESNSDTTFLRGVQSSGDDGVVQFESIFPGHYTGRAVHIHVVTHPGDHFEVLPNNTLAGLYDTRASHVGQIFFDQDLITEVEKNAPYNTNTQALTNNSDDSILETEAETTDPFLEYVLLGDSASDGVFAWISLGINGTRDEYNSPEGY